MKNMPMISVIVISSCLFFAGTKHTSSLKANHHHVHDKNV